METNKTQQTEASVEAYLQGIADEVRRQDCLTVLRLMEQATGEAPRMWGASMVGFGSYHYKYASGHEGDSFLTGFSPRKENLTIYIMPGFDRYGELMARLGKYKTGKSCLYVKRLADVDHGVLADLIRASVAEMKRTYG